jgi:hypothetical protein
MPAQLHLSDIYIWLQANWQPYIATIGAQSQTLQIC